MQYVVRLLYHRDRWVCYFAGRSQPNSGFSHTQKKRNGGRNHGGVPGRSYCINSATLRFVPYEKMASKGYGYLLEIFQE